MSRSRRPSPRAGLFGFAVIAVALAASGCADAGGSGESIRLRVVLADDWAPARAVVDVVQEFEQDHPGVRVQLQGVPFSQIPDVVRAGIEAGEPVDVAQWHAFAAAADRLAEPLDDLWGEHLTDEEFLPGAVEDVEWAGRRYGVPLDTNAMVLLVNATRLQEAGVSLPERATFGDLLEVARATTNADGTPRGIALAASTWTTYGWIRANGGEVVDVGPRGEVTFTLDDPAVVEALAFLGQLGDERIAFPPFSRDESTDAFALFRSGNAAMHVSGSWDVAALLESDVEWDFQVRTLPNGSTGGTSGSALGGSSLFVPLESPHRELAFEFMMALTRDDVALRLAREEGRLPTRHRVFDDALFQTRPYRTVVEQLEVAHPMKLIAFPEATRAFAEALERVITGRDTAASALSRAQAQAVRTLERSEARP